MKFDGFQWDHGNWPKCGKHGVSRAEIEALLRIGKIAPSVSRSSDEQRFVAVGKASSGKPMFVVFVIRQTPEGRFLRPVSARYMHSKEAKRYEAQSSDNDN
jgi:uncharacterized DUF497 family protein